MDNKNKLSINSADVQKEETAKEEVLKNIKQIYFLGKSGFQS